MYTHTDTQTHRQHRRTVNSTELSGPLSVAEMARLQSVAYALISRPARDDGCCGCCCGCGCCGCGGSDPPSQYCAQGVNPNQTKKQGEGGGKNKTCENLYVCVCWVVMYVNANLENKLNNAFVVAAAAVVGDRTSNQHCSQQT